MLTAQNALSKDMTTGKSTMEHRHFATVATIIRGIPDNKTRSMVALRFAIELETTNPRFDRRRFLAACGEVS